MRFAASRPNGSVGYFMAPGTGKTLCAIRTAQPPVLTVCRRDDFLTWETELFEEQRPEPYAITKGSSPLPETPEEFTLVTYDLLKNPRIQSWVKHQRFRTVIADEVQKAKRWKATRTKALIRTVEHIPRRLALTGSAITNSPEDVFSIGLFIDRGRTFGTNWWKFMQRFFLKIGPQWVPRHTAKTDIRSLLPKISYYVHEDDVLQLPPARFFTLAVPMSGVQRRLYERCLEDWEIELPGTRQTIELDYIVQQLAKLRQIAGGFLYLGKDSPPAYFRSHKRRKLVSLCLQALRRRSKIVIWAAFTAEIEAIAADLRRQGEEVVTFHGPSPLRKQSARLSFRDNSRTRFFVGQVDSGIGMNELKVADTAIYYSNSHKVVSRQQSLRRTRRKGSEIHDTIDYYDLLTKGTLDGHILRSIRRSMDFAEFLLERAKHGLALREFLS